MDRQANADPGNEERTKRRKVAIACDACRIKKIKCDGIRPVCGTCSKRRSRKYRKCTWSSPNFEEQQQPSTVSFTPSERHGESVNLDTSPSHQHGSSDRAQASADSNLGVSPDNTRSEAFFGSSNAGSFMNTLRKVFGPSQAPANSGLYSQATRPLVSEASAGDLNLSRAELTLPTRSRADRLFEIFWQVVFPFYPFVNKHDTTQLYFSLWAGQREDDLTSHCLVNVIFALACQLNADDEPNHREEHSRVYFGRAKQLLDPWSIGTIQSVQIHLYLSLYLQSTNEPHHSWTQVGTAVRTAESLGLHLPAASEREASPAKRELYRKVWHGCVLMDRITSVTFGRPPTITSAFALAVPRPLFVDEERLQHAEHLPADSVQQPSQPSVMAFFTHILELYDIIYDQLATPNFTSLRTEFAENETAASFLHCIGANNGFPMLDVERKLLNWEKNLPDHLKLDSSTSHDSKQQIFSSQAFIIYQHYLHLRLISLRPALSAYVFAETRELDIPQSFGGLLLQKVTLQCAVVCVSVAQYTIKAAYDRRFSSSTSIDSVSEWWSNVLWTYSASTVLIAAKICPSVLAEISEEAVDRSWVSAMYLLDQYKEFHPAVAQVLAAAKLLHGALSKHHQYAQGSDLDQIRQGIESNTENVMNTNGIVPEQPSFSTSIPLDFGVSQTGITSMPLSFDSAEFNLDFDFDFLNNDLTWLHTAPFEL